MVKIVLFSVGKRSVWTLWYEDQIRRSNIRKVRTANT